MRAQAPATIKCLLKGFREAGTFCSLISSQENPFGGTQPFLQRNAKARKLGSNFLGQRAAGRNKGSRECTSPEEHAHRHRDHLCHISGTRRKKNTSNHLKDSCECGFSHLVSLLDPSPFPPASLTGLALPTLPSLTPGILVTRHARLEDVLSSRVPFTPRATSLLFSSSLST